jgi:transposase-like protein
MTQITETSRLALLACEEGFDPIEDRLRANIRGTIEAVFDEELNGFLGRLRYGRTAGAVKGYRHGNRDRQIVGTFGTETISVPRARIEDEAGRVSEWRSKALPRYQRLTKTAGALIASVYLAGTNTRRVKCALFALFKGAVSKDVVSRAWRKVKGDWDAWCARSLADEDIIRLILDGTVIKTRLDKKATNISVLAAIGVRRDGQKVLLSIKNMGGESTAAWRQFLDDLEKRGLKRPQFVIVDGAPGLEAALVALWGDDLPIQRCTVHKHRNLLAHAPKHMHEELGNDYRDMIYADTAAEVETRRKAFVRNWRLKCRAVADSLEEAGDRLFTFTRLDPSQWKAARTTNAIERLNEEFRRRIKTQAVLPCAETVPMLLWALLAAGQITMRKVDGWQTLDKAIQPMTLDLAA